MTQEQWENTLQLFENMMPSIFNNVFKVWQSAGVQDRLNHTKTVNNIPMSEASRKYFQTGPLKQEYDIYIFTRALFNERLRRFDIQQVQ